MSAYFMTDVHTHLYDEKFFRKNGKEDYSDLDEIIEQCQRQSIGRIIVVAEEEESARRVVELCQRYPNVIRGGIGLHPCCVKDQDQIKRVRDLILQHQDLLCCIGEVGLDFTPGVLNAIKERNPHLENTDQVKQLQRQALETFVELSKETNLPLNVHSRSAGRPTIQFLHEKGATKVLMHCFDGSAKVVKEGLKYGYYFSIPSNVVRSPQLRQLIEVVPMNRILLETDSPALVPNLPKKEDFSTVEEFEQAIQNARNDPSTIPLSAQTIAEVKGIDLSQVVEQTYLNTKDLFPRAVQ